MAIRSSICMRKEEKVGIGNTVRRKMIKLNKVRRKLL